MLNCLQKAGKLVGGGGAVAIVHVKNKKNGTTYVYESENYWDKEKKQTRSKHKCIGKIDPETGRIIPLKHLAIEPLVETKPGPVPVTKIKHSFYGMYESGKHFLRSSAIPVFSPIWSSR